MTRRSLRMRLWIAALASIAVAIALAGLGLVTLFERHVERRIGVELRVQLNQLTAAVTIDADGAVALTREPPDPRFAQPLSGLYWQIDGWVDGTLLKGLLRSRSLWDTVIDLPDDRLDTGAVHTHRLPGPANQRLLISERLVRLEYGGETRALRLAVGLDRAEIDTARNAFAADMAPYLALIAVLLAVATFIQIQTGLAPLETVRRGVEAIRSGRARRLTDTYPDEVMPLVGEVNGLLAAREQAIERARAWTADLAHGLKTPLSALGADAQRLREQGQTALADDLEQLAQGMRRRVDRELVRARIRSGTQPRQARVEVVDALNRLLRTLQRTPDGARLAWQVTAPPRATAALMADDLFELLGNLLENAAKWARQRVWVEVTAGERIVLRITDDGPGVATEQLPRLGERGLRLDERKDGSGLGLAIARDVVDAYGGDLTFDVANEGGLKVQVELPSAD
ncbi:signal transduction histidine kinase [Thioflavicoccus mobilis 8321]|uniref:histidine kinase n=1 Tax=Thioflavicoccus mobilis 8321 TaxID=765912 RepID=L0GUS9_9GAMM|nr:HAMP domain-containing sensor histidine kinase [Thioflavicoccus mobilis]AGA90498.1 signal transduction histidine kinase [Thioflavicoccus mobilis 8321]